MKAIVDPRAEFEFACLIIEREIGDIDGARGTEFGGRWPENVAIRLDDGPRIEIAAGVIVGTEDRMRIETADQK